VTTVAQENPESEDRRGKQVDGMYDRRAELTGEDALEPEEGGRAGWTGKFCERGTLLQQVDHFLETIGFFRQA